MKKIFVRFFHELTFHKDRNIMPYIFFEFTLGCDQPYSALVRVGPEVGNVI
jgi:hypothetical protein